MIVTSSKGRTEDTGCTTDILAALTDDTGCTVDFVKGRIGDGGCPTDVFEVACERAA
jgi:hypothetical protein